MNHLFLALWRQGFAQPADMHIHRTFIHIHITAPDPVEQLPPGKNPVGVQHKEFQQAEFQRPQGNRLTGNAGFLGLAVNAQLVGHHRLVIHQAAAAAQ